MNIYTTASDDFNAFRKFFYGHEVKLLPPNYKGLKIDLLVFPGGADVHPKRYGSKIPHNSNYAGWINEERDEWEFEVFRNVMKGITSVKKVLGVCRGLQLLNVALGGSLMYDIASRFGKPHPNIHPIIWSMATVFSSVTHVNSIHHQGIYGLGESMNFRILANEPESGMIEAIVWGDMILGMQFHPELWGNRDEMKVFSKGILEWIEGKPLLVGGRTVEVSGRKMYSKTSVKYNYKANDTADTSWTPPPPSELQEIINNLEPWAADDLDNTDDPDEDEETEEDDE